MKLPLSIQKAYSKHLIVSATAISELGETIYLVHTLFGRTDRWLLGRKGWFRTTKRRLTHSE